MKNTLFLILFLFAYFANADTIRLTNSVDLYNIEKTIQYLVDEKSILNENSIREQPYEHWKHLPDMKYTSFGIEQSVYWFKFNVLNTSDFNHWKIFIDYQTLDSVSLFLFDSTGVLTSKKVAGITTSNVNGNRMPVFDFDCKKHAFFSIYLRIKTSSQLIVPIYIASPTEYIKKDAGEKAAFLPAFGIIISAIIFNILLFFIYREKAYIFLSLSVLSLLVFISSVNGFLYEHFGDSETLSFQKIRFFSGGMTYFLHILFVIFYLNLKQFKKFFIIEISLASFFLLYSVLTGTGILSSHIAGKLLFPALLLFVVSQFAMAVVASLRKIRSARYYLLSFSPFIPAILILFLNFSGKVTLNPFLNNIGLYASSIFVISLTSGLAEKLYKIKQEKARAYQLSLDKEILEKEIEQRKIIELQLKESEEKFKNLFDLSPLPVLVTELESGFIVDCNLALLSFSGMKRDEIIGKTTYELGFIDFEKRTQLSEMIKKGNQVFAYETDVRVMSGIKNVNLFLSGLTFNNKKHIITLVSDITLQKKSELKLKELNLTKDKFISIIAHDLVNPFHALILYGKELLPLTRYNERAANYNECLIQTAQNTYNLLQNLLTWARAQTGQISFVPQLIDMNDFIENISSNSQTISNTKKIEIISEINESIVVEADLQMLSTILRNLISNAIKFSFENGKIIIRTFSEGEFINISIRDFGIGMDREVKKNIFNLYETSQRPGTIGESGTGLGLIICKEFILLHSGRINVESTVGEGSTFTVRLPKKQT